MSREEFVNFLRRYDFLNPHECLLCGRPSMQVAYRVRTGLSVVMDDTTGIYYVKVVSDPSKFLIEYPKGLQSIRDEWAGKSEPLFDSTYSTCLGAPARFIEDYLQEYYNYLTILTSILHGLGGEVLAARDIIDETPDVVSSWLAGPLEEEQSSPIFKLTCYPKELGRECVTYSTGLVLTDLPHPNEGIRVLRPDNIAEDSPTCIRLSESLPVLGVYGDCGFVVVNKNDPTEISSRREIREFLSKYLYSVGSVINSGGITCKEIMKRINSVLYKI